MKRGNAADTLKGSSSRQWKRNCRKWLGGANRPAFPKAAATFSKEQVQYSLIPANHNESASMLPHR